MKKSFLTLLILLSFSFVWSQAPNKMSYQAVVRDADNTLVSNQSVGVKVSILSGAPDGTSVYEETQNVNSNLNGLISIIIGEGNNTTGSFSTIDWASNTHYIKSEIDPNGGTNYTIVGVQQLLSVPYAMHAITADNLGGVEGSEVGEMLYWDGDNWLNIPKGNHGQFLTNCNGIPSWGFCVSTQTTSVLSSTVARFRCEISNDGGSPITERGVCYSTSPTPTTNDLKTIAYNPGIGVWHAALGGLTPNTTYYARTYGINEFGTLYGNEVSVTTTSELGVGDFHPNGSGVIFYILQPGDPGYDSNNLHGLIVSPIELDEVEWGCDGTEIGTSTEMFTGLNNTNLITSSCTESNIAAKLCSNFTFEGFDDWYLGSIDEFIKLQFVRQSVNASLSENIDYDIIMLGTWTSSEYTEYNGNYTSDYSYLMRWTDISGYAKTATNKVRPFRTF